MCEDWFSCFLSDHSGCPNHCLGSTKYYVNFKVKIDWKDTNMLYNFRKSYSGYPV